jgi:3'-5' exonuclease
VTWLAQPEQWTKLGQRLQTIGEFALDTETYGQPDKTSPQHRARVHCWSVGVLTQQRHPRGYNIATGVVLPAAALDDAAIRSALANPAVRKWAHNAPHDYHSIMNMGVEVNGLEDTLQWSRVAVPGMSQYNLKAMSQWALGKPARPVFKEVTGYQTVVRRSTWRKDKTCVCGKKPCRAKSSSDWFDPKLGWWRNHERLETAVETVHEREITAYYEVPQFIPGADLQPLVWHGQTIDRMVAWESYSLEDALDGIELVSWLRGRPTRSVTSPWSP